MAQSKENIAIQSQKRVNREKRDVEIFLSYYELLDKGSMKLATAEHLAEKHSIVPMTVYNIMKRMRSHIKSDVAKYPEFQERYNRYELNHELVSS